MRVKTVPRQRASQGARSEEDSAGGVVEGRELVSLPEERGTEEAEGETTTEEGIVDQPKEDPPEGRGEKEKCHAGNYSEEALDMSIKHKISSPKGTSVQAGPSCCRPFKNDEPSSEDSKDCPTNDANNNNIPPPAEYHPPGTFGDDSPPPEESSSTSRCSSSPEAVNLCKKDQPMDPLPASPSSGEKLKDTFLYKIMTDPTFLESIQKQKQQKRHVCQFCKQEFVNGDDLADHLDVKKDESNQVVCCACKKTFAQKRYLRYHQRCHSERTKFTCDICTKKYTRMDNLSRHSAFHVNPDKFACTYCEKTFARKDLLNKHLKCHDNKYRFYCDTCQKYFKGPLTLDNHRKNFHAVG